MDVSAGAVTVTVTGAAQLLLIPSIGTIVMSEPSGSVLVDCRPVDALTLERMEDCDGVGIAMEDEGWTRPPVAPLNVVCESKVDIVDEVSRLGTVAA